MSAGRSVPSSQAPSAKLGESGPVRRALRRQFSSLAEFNYRLFFAGQLVSQIGSWMQMVGQGWLILQLTGSATALGIATMLQALPFTALSLVGGVLADRLPKRKTLIVVQSFATLQALTLSILVITDTVVVWHVYLLALLLGITNAIERPTRQSFFSELVSRDNLVNAVALNSSLLNVARILGPALGGVVIALVGVQGTFVFNTLSFLAVLAGYFFMRPALFHPARNRPADAGLVHQIAEGLRYGWGTPPVRFILILVAFIGMFGYNFNVIIPLVAEFVLHAGPEKFGLLSSFLGAGALVSAFAIAGMGRRSPAMMLAASAVFCVALYALAFSTWYLLSGVLLLLLGLSGAALMTTANTSLQLGAPDEMRGRIISIFILLQAGSTPVGGFLTGYLSSHVGVPSALAIQASLCVLGVALAALQLSIARRNDP
ncbi:MAG: MFS transporter [Dehalococcoidia bacterium]